MDEARFREYVSHFNAARYSELVAFFTDDVELTFPNGNTLHGPDGIVEFYRPVHAAVREVLRIDFLLIGRDKIATELYTEFHALKDFPEFPSRPLSAGEVMRITSFVHYDLEGERYRRIRVARYLNHDEVRG